MLLFTMIRYSQVDTAARPRNFTGRRHSLREDVLHHVLGLVAVAQDSPGDRQRPAAVLSVQVGDRR